MFDSFKNMKDMYELLKNADMSDPVATLVKMGMPEEEANAAVAKMESLKEIIVKKSMNGEIKKPEDVISIIRESGIIPEEHFDKIMESIKGRE